MTTNLRGKHLNTSELGNGVWTKRDVQRQNTSTARRGYTLARQTPFHLLDSAIALVQGEGGKPADSWKGVIWSRDSGIVLTGSASANRLRGDNLSGACNNVASRLRNGMVVYHLHFIQLDFHPLYRW